MAVVDLLSSIITNRDASPRAANDPKLEKGRLREAVGFVETNLDDSIASTYRLCQVPSGARIAQVLLWADGASATGDMDLGLYQTTDKGSAVVDADFFASAIDINAAALSAVDVTHESAVYGLEDAEKTLWEALGLSADPFLDYDIVGTLTAALTTTAQTIMVKVRYVL